MNRNAITLLETVVCIAIISVLGCLLLVAVNHARESARRIDCGNRQRNVLLAVEAHLGQHNRYPRLLTMRNLSINFSGGFGPTFALLPYMECEAFAESLVIARNEHVSRLIDGFRPDWVQCPSDTIEGRSNLRFCVGSLPPIGLIPLKNYRNNGIFGLSRPATPSDLMRGSETTLVISERIACRQNNNKFESMDGFARYRFGTSLPSINAETIRRLQGMEPDYVDDEIGLDPFERSFPHTVFNTTEPPNLEIRDVLVAGGDLGAIVSARSRHAAGVNAGFASGAVRFISDSIDGSVWARYGIANEQ